MVEVALVVAVSVDIAKVAALGTRLLSFVKQYTPIYCS